MRKLAPLFLCALAGCSEDRAQHPPAGTTAADASMLDGSARDGSIDSGSPTHVAVGVTMRIAGGHCPDCFRTFSATTEGLLALEDSDGREVFVLTSDEREQLGHIVHDADFVQALEQPFVWRCEAPSDVSVDLEVHWQDGASQSARVSDGCFGRCNQPTHPFMRLKVLLFALKERYVACGPNRWRSQEPCGVAPQPPPGGRMLCAVCVDDCGVPLPEGSRTELDPDVCDVPCDAGVKGPCFADCVPFQYPDAGQNAGGP